MSPPGRPKGEYRSAHHEGTPPVRGERPRLRRIALLGAALALLLAVFEFYLRPDLVLVLATQLWNCF